MKATTLIAAAAATIFAVPVLLSPVTGAFLTKTVKIGADNTAALAGKTVEPVRTLAHPTAQPTTAPTKLQTYQP